MNYKTTKKDNKFIVLESKTEHIIKICDSQEEAKRLMKHLNLGGGFDSWTPNFFLKSVKMSEN